MFLNYSNDFISRCCSIGVRMLKEYTKFYYYVLPAQKQVVYKVLYDGIREKRQIIDIFVDARMISLREIYEVIQYVYNDTPSFYYLKVTSPIVIGTYYGYRMYSNYIYSDSQIAEYDAQLEVGLKKFREKYITSAMTDYEKEKMIHDFLVKTVSYDYDVFNSGSSMPEEAFNVLGALLKKKAVCWGISCAFKLLCDYCELKSFVVLGDIVPKQGPAGHAWNMVKLDDEEYHVDVTWDIKEKGDISFCYDYLNLDDNLIRFDHTWSTDIYPKCKSNKHNYYYKHNLYVKSLDELTNYIRNRIRCGDTYIAVKYAANMPPEDTIVMAIQRGIQQAMCWRGYRYVVRENTHNIYIEIV